ncbi:MAG: PA0069 family radical SAM protein [Pseudomonadales bacterium]|nr:PA0069 family radical SAM protein [Pseudomonadales bacterium]
MSISLKTPAQLGQVRNQVKARGSSSRMAGRFEKSLSFFDASLSTELSGNVDPSAAGHEGLSQAAEALQTQIIYERAKSILTRNNSPDVPFNYSINPYRGCEHGCSYCFARPSHSYLDLSPGLDFESKLIVKENAPELLIKTLAKPGYRCEHFALGANTDCYQPIEKQFRLTRRILEICLAFNHPVSIITKGALLLRDLDLLEALNQQQLISVAVTVTTLSSDLKAAMEPRAAAIQSRLQIIESLTKRRIPVSVLIAPIIPKINDHELEMILQAVAALGVKHAGYVLLRLPHELGTLFSQWLSQHFPLKADAVMSLMSTCHEGEIYRSEFGVRQRGSGNYADLIAQRFHVGCNKLGLNQNRVIPRDAMSFRVPRDLEVLMQPMEWQIQRKQALGHMRKDPDASQMSLF